MRSHVASGPSKLHDARTVEDALALAAKLAIDAGDFDRAAEVIALMKRSKPRPVTDLTVVRGSRGDADEGNG
jgi:hypothetical protein